MQSIFQLDVYFSVVKTNYIIFDEVKWLRAITRIKKYAFIIIPSVKQKRT